MSLKRTPSVGRRPGRYPDVRQIGKAGRNLARLLSRGALGIGLAGLVGCVGDGDFIPYKMSGKDVEPEDVSSGDLPTGDHKEPDWNIQGGIPWPEDVHEDGLYPEIVLPGMIADIEGDGSCPLPDLQPWELAGVAPPDVEEEFPPLAGDPRPPEDVVSEELPPLAGDMPMPDAVPTPDAGSTGDAKGEVDSEFPPLDGDMAWPEEG